MPATRRRYGGVLAGPGAKCDLPRADAYAGLKELPNEPALSRSMTVDEMVEGNTRRIVADPVSSEGSVEIELTG